MALERWFPVDPRIVPIARHMAYRTAKDLGASDDESADLDLAIGELSLTPFDTAHRMAARRDAMIISASDSGSTMAC